MCEGPGLVIDIYWADRKLQKACSTDRTGRKRFGADRWTKLTQRVFMMESAASLSVLENAPGRFHPLHADKAGTWAVSLNGNYRMLFEPANEPLPLLDDGGLDPSRVTAVRILEVADYHGR